VQLNPLEFFGKIMIPAAAPYNLSRGLRIRPSACPGSPSSSQPEMLIGGRRHRFLLHLGTPGNSLAHQRNHPGAVLCSGIIGFVLDRLIAGLGKVRDPRHVRRLKGNHHAGLF